jgi:acylphosphatase
MRVRSPGLRFSYACSSWSSSRRTRVCVPTRSKTKGSGSIGPQPKVPPVYLPIGGGRTQTRGYFALLTTMVSAESDMQQKQAISATVTGNDQQVGFRAMIMKQAIEYNLAGYAENEANRIVHFMLQGNSDRLSSALAAIRGGTKKSSKIEVNATPAAVDSGLDRFTIIDWTSTSRDITTPYTLVFALRADDEAISKSEAKDVWHEILRKTLRGEDLQKLDDGD